MTYDLPSPVRDILHPVEHLHGPLARSDIQALLAEPHRAIPGDLVATRQSGRMIDGIYHGTFDIVELGTDGPVAHQIADLPKSLHPAAKLCAGAVQDDREIHEVIREHRPDLYSSGLGPKRLLIFRFHSALGVVSYSGRASIPAYLADNALFVECEDSRGITDRDGVSAKQATVLKETDRQELVDLWELIRRQLT